MTRNQRISETAREVIRDLRNTSRYYEVQIGGLSLHTRVAILDSKALAELEERMLKIIEETEPKP